MRLLILLACFAASLSAAVPYRFLLVCGDQWKDDGSRLLDRPGEFQITAALLKTWGLPFDILRLDQQRLDAYHLLDRDGSPLYGTIVWDVPDPKNRDLHMLAELNSMGVSIIVIGDSVRAPEIARLAGLRYISDFKAHDEASLDKAHFITRALAGRERELLENAGYSYDGVKVTPDRAKIIARRGAAPFVTILDEPARGRIVWLGYERNPRQLQNQLSRDLLKRSIVWAQGYAVYAQYDRSIILFMDDWGTSDKTYLSYWHYKTPTEEEIRRGLIDPLQKHHAIADLNVNTGFVDRKTRRILRPWTQRVVDELDGRTIHDYASTKRGIDAGVKAGVFAIESHGWTHMLPDLDSPPGPFWDAALDGVATLDWYNEFADNLRHAEVPAATQRFHLLRSIETIREDFGVTPHLLRAGGSLYSKSPANNTSAVAASLGFGMASWDCPVFLSRDLVLSLDSVSRRKSWAYDQRLTAADVPWSVDAPYWIGFHDRDLAMDAAAVGRLLDGLGEGVRYLTSAEYSAYLHASVRRRPGEDLRFSVDYDPHYSDWFASHPSRWTIHLSDEVRSLMGSGAPEKRIVKVPPGVGTHDL